MRLFLAALLIAAGASPAAAQQSTSSAFQGFSGRSDEPVNVEADNLEVREKDQAAVFTGNVFVTQGNSELRSRKLTIYYYNSQERKAQAGGGKPAEGQSQAKPDAQAGAKPAEGAAPAAAGDPDASRDIRRMEAEGDVVVTSKDQRATGARGVFDTQSNMVTLNGGVVVSQGGNVVRGESLVVNLTTQVSRVEGAKGSRVQGVFKPKPRQPAAQPQR
jgi:lipopolysaccharide export system protein LptA